jgi:hypothetical protein
MNAKDFDLVLENRISQMRASLKSKGKEYSPGEDRLRNFKDAADLQEETPEQALFGMMAKHLIALKDFVFGPERYNIPYSFWNEKIMDIGNYLVLLDALVTERVRDDED